MRKVFFRLSELGGATMFLTYPISVSLSQMGLAIAILGWLGFALGGLGKKNFGEAQAESQSKATAEQAVASADEKESQMHLPWIWDSVLLGLILVYIFEIISLVVNAALSRNGTAFFLEGIQSEPKDMLLVFAAFWTLAYTKHAKNRKKALRWLRWSIWILVVTGFLSVWSKYRLNKLFWFIGHDWTVGPNARLQHHLGTIPLGNFPLHFYMPIGLMNTHLTYGGLLMFAFPALLLSVFHPYIKNPSDFWRGKNRGILWKKTAFLGLASLIFVLNNARSAILGACAASLIGIFYFGVSYWKKDAKRLLPLSFAAILLLGGFAVAAPKIHPRLAIAIQSLFSGKKKHTDYQRALVWNGSLALSEASPAFGVGPGHFERELKKHILTFSEKYPHLWPWYELAQRGHAHNDYLHLLAIAGTGALFAYFVFFGKMLYVLLGRLPGELEFWKFGVIGLFFAGFLQCYFQDDEVLLPFLLYLGLILGATYEDRNEPGLSQGVCPRLVGNVFFEKPKKSAKKCGMKAGFASQILRKFHYTNFFCSLSKKIQKKVKP